MRVRRAPRSSSTGAIRYLFLTAFNRGRTATLFEGSSNNSCQDKMDSYPSRATTIGMPVFGASSHIKHVVLGRSLRLNGSRV